MSYVKITINHVNMTSSLRPTQTKVSISYFDHSGDVTRIMRVGSFQEMYDYLNELKNSNLVPEFVAEAIKAFLQGGK